MLDRLSPIQISPEEDGAEFRVSDEENQDAELAGAEA